VDFEPPEGHFASSESRFHGLWREFVRSDAQLGVDRSGHAESGSGAGWIGKGSLINTVYATTTLKNAAAGVLPEGGH